MGFLFHQLNHPHEQLKLVSFCCPKGMFVEEGDDTADNIFEFADSIDHQLFRVIVLSWVSLNLPAAKSATDQLKSFLTGGRLSYRKFCLYLDTQFHVRMGIDGNGKASFTIDESGDPTVQFNHGLSC